MPDASFEQYTRILQPGDSVLFYTDGVTETFNAEGEEFGEDRLVEVLRQHRGAGPGHILDAVEQAVIRHSQGGKASDDLTLLIVQRN
jgi:sigma-B regulation protein RsbU (phosphoserine phosphatase)